MQRYNIMHPTQLLELYAGFCLLACIMLFVPIPAQAQTPRETDVPLHSPTSCLVAAISARYAFAEATGFDAKGQNDIVSNEIIFGIGYDLPHLNVILALDAEFNYLMQPAFYSVSGNIRSARFVFGAGIRADIIIQPATGILNYFVAYRAILHFVRDRGGLFEFDLRAGLDIAPAGRSLNRRIRPRFKLFAMFPFICECGAALNIDIAPIALGFEIGVDF